jgi:hypothetical protein
MIDLNLYKNRIYSQDGEDGMISKFFEELNIEKGWYCEFGATDGYMVSNTRCLREKGWNGVLIEGNPDFYKQMTKNLGENPNVFLFEKYVSNEKGEKLDEILADSPIPEDFDLLSIDIDGNDLWVWESMLKYSPKLVIVEYNSNFDSESSLTIQYDKNHRHNDDDYFGATVGAFNRLAVRKGYDLIGYTQCLNLFFAKKEFSSNFKKYFPSDIRMQRGHKPSGKMLINY